MLCVCVCLLWVITGYIRTTDARCNYQCLHGFPSRDDKTAYRLMMTMTVTVARRTNKAAVSATPVISNVLSDCKSETVFHCRSLHSFKNIFT